MDFQVPNQDDVEKNKPVAILAYIIFFIPLLAARESRFAMFHANQGFLVFLTVVAVNVVGMIIPVIGWFIIFPLGSLFALVLVILGIINAVNGQMKPLPLLGKIEIFK